MDQLKGQGGWFPADPLHQLPDSGSHELTRQRLQTQYQPQQLGNGSQGPGIRRGLHRLTPCPGIMLLLTCRRGEGGYRPGVGRGGVKE